AAAIDEGAVEVAFLGHLGGLPVVAVTAAADPDPTARLLALRVRGGSGGEASPGQREHETAPCRRTHMESMRIVLPAIKRSLGTPIRWRRPPAWSARRRRSARAIAS